MVMSRLYTVLGTLLILGGVAALIGQAWALGAILLVLGVVQLAVEIRAGRRRGHVPLEGGPDAAMEKTKAIGLANAQFGINANYGAGSGSGGSG